MSKEPEASQTEPAKTFEFKAEIQQLLNILVHSLYTEREIFLRELLSNASDALNRIQFEMLTNRDVLDPDAELAIHVEADQEAGTLTISDTGIGMTREEIAEDLGTIAHSGAAAFLKKLDTEQRPSVELIGQFGVGFYSVFMVAERVRVVSRSYQAGAEAIEWISDGGSEYHLGFAEKAGRGTRIEIKLKEDAAEFAAPWRLEQIIRKHSDYVAFPIYVGDSEKPTNQQEALWRQSPREVTTEQYDEFFRHLTLDLDKPLLHTHLVTDAPVNLRSLLYIPAHRERGFLSPRTDHGLKLYVHNVMIQEYNKDLLPGYLRFVEGVVESEDLPLNISREVVQSSPAARRIQKALVRKLVKELEALSESEPEAYASFWNEFGPFIKEGVADIPSAGSADKDDLLPLLRFHSSRTGSDLISLSEYVERMRQDQDAIYYVLGDNLKSVAQSPHLDYFKARDIEVLYMVDPIDSFLTLAVSEYDGKSFKNVDSAGLELPQDQDAEQEATDILPEPDFNRLVGRFVKVLSERVVEVRESKALRDSPCRLVSPDGAPERDMSRIYRMLGQEFEMPKRILEINRSHPIIVNLAHLVSKTPEADVIDATIDQLFDNLLLVEGLHPNPTAMIPRIQQLMEMATASRSANGAERN
jgi:molecular chaperone HtpG